MVGSTTTIAPGVACRPKLPSSIRRPVGGGVRALRAGNRLSRLGWAWAASVSAFALAFFGLSSLPGPFFTASNRSSRWALGRVSF